VVFALSRQINKQKVRETT